MPLSLKNFEQVLQQQINYLVARTSLVDVTDVSTVKHLLAAEAREVDEVYFQLGKVPDLFSIDTATGEDLDERGQEVQPDAVSRRLATKATGSVVFSRAGTTGTTTIPAGTVVKTSSGQKFSTTAVGTIGNGSSSSSSVSAVALEAGAAGNVASGTVVKFDSKPAGVDSVTNPSAFVGGEDKETDDSYRARMKSYMRSLARGTPTALLFSVIGATIDSGKRVAYAHVYEDLENRGEVILYVDDGSGTAEEVEVVSGENVTAGLGGPVGSGDSAVGGETYLYLDKKPVRPTVAENPMTLSSSVHGVLVHGTHYLLEDASAVIKMLDTSAEYATGLAAGEVITGSYTAYAGLIALCQKIIDGDPDDRTTYPGWRAAGVRVRVRPPAVLQQVVTASIQVADGFDRDTVVGLCEDAVQTYINSLGISGDVLRSELIAAIMSVDGVRNTVLTSPANDVILLDDQLPRVTTANITLT